MLLKAFHTRRLERNLGNTLSYLQMTSLVTARIVSNLAPLQILRVGVFLLICWTCTPTGNVPFQKNRYIKHTVNDRLKVARSIALQFRISFAYDKLFNQQSRRGTKSCLARPRFPLRFSHRVFYVRFFLAPLARLSLVYIFSFSFCRHYQYLL